MKFAEIDEGFRIWYISEELELLEKSKKAKSKLIPEFIIEYANNYVVSANCRTVEIIRLPKKLDLENARKYFARLMSADFIVRTAMGYKWVCAPAKGKHDWGIFV